MVREDLYYAREANLQPGGRYGNVSCDELDPCFFIGFLFPFFISFFGERGGGGGGSPGQENCRFGSEVKEFSQVETARRDEWESHRDHTVVILADCFNLRHRSVFRRAFDVAGTAACGCCGVCRNAA